MPQYFSPGVYVEEVDSGPRPIQGVSTSVTGMVGVTERGPSSGKPELVTSFGEFVKLFGGFLDEPDATTKAKLADDGCWWLFAHAVRGFFDNGGQQLYVKRVVSQGARKASSVLGQGVISEILRDAKKGDIKLVVRHVIGRDTSDTNKSVKLISGKTGVEIGSFEITNYRQSPTESVITLNTGLPERVSAAQGDYLEFSRDFDTKRLKLAARSEGKWGESLRVTVRPMVGETLTLKFNESVGDSAASTILAGEAIAPSAGTTRNIQLAEKTGFATNDTIRIGSRKFTLSLEDHNCKQSLAIDESAGPVDAASRFKLSFRGELTADLAPDATAATLETALRDLTSIGATGVSCTGGDLPAAIVIEFQGALAASAVEPLTVIQGDLSPAAAVVEVTQIGGNAAIERASEDTTPLPKGAEVRKLRKATDGNATAVYLSGASRLYKEAIVELDNGKIKATHIVTDVAPDSVSLDSSPVAGFFEGDALRVIEAEVIAEYAPNGIVQETEVFQNLKLVSPNIDDPLLISNHLTKRSRLITMEADAAAVLGNSGVADFPLANRLNLSGGDNKFESLTVNDFIGENLGSGKRTGIQSFEDIEDISIVMVPGMWSETIVTELITHCETMRYRVAVLDAPYKANITEVQEYRARFDSSRAALYHPWIEVRNPTSGDSVDVPPSGATAGIYADVDARRGVHKAPANEVIRSIVGLQQDITRREQDLINPRGINALRFFPGRGNRVWGARTISSDSNFRYINVRRIFNFIERSIDEGTQFVVFEPNDAQLWSRVRQTINNFLNTQWRAGMLEGKTAEEAYFVACDRGTTMTQDDIENGRLICEVGIAPVYPAEFVIFRIQKFTADSKLA